MGVEFVNITVNSYNLYKSNTRDYGTVAVVGVGGQDTYTDPITIGSYSEADTIFGTSALGLGVKAALLNGAATVVAVESGTSDRTAIQAALAKIEEMDIQVVAIAGIHELSAEPYISTDLKAHCETNAGIARIGVFQLAAGEDVATMPPTLGTLKTGGYSRLFGVAHNSTSEVACAVAGLIASLKPWESPLLKPLTGIEQTSSFTSLQIAALKGVQINPLVTPTYITGGSFVLGSDFTMGTAGSGLEYLDTRRVIDDITYKLKAGLTDPGIIGHIHISKPGLAVLLGRVAGILQGCVTAGEIDSFEVNFPIIAALSKPIASRSAGDTALITAARTNRAVYGEVVVVYAGVLHEINIDIKMTV